METVLIKPPVREPLSLTDLKLHLRLAGDAEDSLLFSMLGAARMIVEEASGQRLLAQDWRLVFDSWPAGGLVRLPVSPVLAINAVRVSQANGVDLTLPSSSWALNRTAGTLLISGAPAPGIPRSGIQIDMTAGFGTTEAQVPETLRHAVRLLVARLYEERGDGTARDLPPDIRTLIQAYRKVRL